jgi:hypothetical protein
LAGRYSGSALRTIKLFCGEENPANFRNKEDEQDSTAGLKLDWIINSPLLRVWLKV